MPEETETTALPIRKAVVLSRKLIWKRERTPLR